MISVPLRKHQPTGNAKFPNSQPLRSFYNPTSTEMKKKQEPIIYSEQNSVMRSTFTKQDNIQKMPSPLSFVRDSQKFKQKIEGSMPNNKSQSDAKYEMRAKSVGRNNLIDKQINSSNIYGNQNYHNIYLLGVRMSGNNSALGSYAFDYSSGLRGSGVFVDNSSYLRQSSSYNTKKLSQGQFEQERDLNQSRISSKQEDISEIEKEYSSVLSGGSVNVALGQKFLNSNKQPSSENNAHIQISINQPQRKAQYTNINNKINQSNGDSLNKNVTTNRNSQNKIGNIEVVLSNTQGSTEEGQSQHKQQKMDALKSYISSNYTNDSFEDTTKVSYSSSKQTQIYKQTSSRKNEDNSIMYKQNSYIAKERQPSSDMKVTKKIDLKNIGQQAVKSTFAIEDSTEIIPRLNEEMDINIEEMHFYAVEFQQNCKKWFSKIESTSINKQI